ncbi:major royal jelly protein 1-like isoform X1 [Osmia bicornis bicornis]|uniref:major royal jelly protein 1-like isoform X1 n=2 Tax=Osmia bicornis bicornis TaxID=1437191 RepID=UPI001EAF2403|nr:major royal jelly protein 1-like isoform X1 [Osmia bicornis bicornis]
MRCSFICLTSFLKKTDNPNMKASWLLLLCFAAVSFQNAVAVSKKEAMKVIKEWKYIDYKYDNEEQKQSAINSGEYNYKNCFPVDVDRWNDKTFVTVIRDEGVPSSLNIVSKEVGKGGPLLTPYPDWSWASTSSCNNIINVYRIAIDRCDRLWVLDTGVKGSDRICPTKLLVFYLPTSKLIKRVTIPDNIAMNTTIGQGLLVTPVVQTFGRGCQKTFVYMADVDGYGLIFYDGSFFRRITSTALDSDPKATVFTIQKESFTLQDGPVGMALSPFSGNIYYSPMSSFNLDIVNTRSIIESGGTGAWFKEYKNILWTQSSAKAMSDTGTLFFGLVNNTSIGCWNEYRQLRRSNIDLVALNEENLQFTSGLKVKSCAGREDLYAMTNRFQKISSGSLNFNEINFRILKGDVFTLIQNTRCKPERYRYY